MTFEPLIHIPYAQACFTAVSLTLLISSAIGVLVGLGMFLAKSDEWRTGLIATIAVGTFIGVPIVATTIQRNQVETNEAIVFVNVHKKYNVEGIEFNKRTGRTGDYFPEQSSPQPLKIKVEGKTRVATLVQNRETSEPTLLDVDNGQPMNDLLRDQSQSR